MSELTLVLIKFAYLAILWIFVLSAVSVVRSDLFGARVPSSARTPDRRPDPGRGGAKPGRPMRRGAPTHLEVVEGDNVGARAESQWKEEEDQEGPLGRRRKCDACNQRLSGRR